MPSVARSAAMSLGFREADPLGSLAGLAHPKDSAVVGSDGAGVWADHSQILIPELALSMSDAL